MLSLTVVCALITACYCTAVPWADEAERYPYRLRRTSNVQLYTKIYIYFTTKNKISTDFVLLLYFIITSSCNSTGARPQAKTIMNQIGNIMHRRCVYRSGPDSRFQTLEVELAIKPFGQHAQHQQREQMAYGSLPRQLGTVHTDPEAMQARLLRSRLA